MFKFHPWHISLLLLFSGKTMGFLFWDVGLAITCYSRRGGVDVYTLELQNDHSTWNAQLCYLNTAAHDFLITYLAENSKTKANASEIMKTMHFSSFITAVWIQPKLFILMKQSVYVFFTSFHHNAIHMLFHTEEMKWALCKCYWTCVFKLRLLHFSLGAEITLLAEQNIWSR